MEIFVDIGWYSVMSRATQIVGKFIRKAPTDNGQYNVDIEIHQVLVQPSIEVCRMCLK